VKKKSQRNGCSCSALSAKDVVKAELKAMSKAYRRVSATRASALAFLMKAGIVDSKGKLTKHYR